MGLLAIRTHVDTCDDRLLAVDALIEVKRKVASYLDLQLVAFPQDGFYRSASARDNTLRALDRGVDVVGGIPHFERTMEDGRASVRELCTIASDRGLFVDMHCDETDDPMSRHIETLTAETQRLGLSGRVAGSHLTSMHSMDNYYVSKLLPLMAEAGIAAIPNPLINIVIQGRHDTYPKRRGMTRVKELDAAGVNVACGHDSIMDPWYPLGRGSMLDALSMLVHVAQMTGRAELYRAYEMVTTNPARAAEVPWGVKEGLPANFVVFDCEDEAEAIRLRPAARWVVRQGRVVAETEPARSVVFEGDAARPVTFTRETARRMEGVAS
jgi:cytosine deaminase